MDQALLITWSHRVSREVRCGAASTLMGEGGLGEGDQATPPEGGWVGLGRNDKSVAIELIGVEAHTNQRNSCPQKDR